MDLIDTIDSFGKSGSKVAHVYRGSSLTYENLVRASDALACWLIDEFGDDKTPVVVYGHKQHEMLISFLACVKSGHAYIPVDSSLPYERVKDIIENSEARLLICIDDLADISGSFDIKNRDHLVRIISGNNGSVPDKNFSVKAEDTYYIIYTSGSTGKPKGVQITLSCLESFIKWGLALCRLNIDKNYVFLNQAPFSFDLSVMDLYLSLASGSTLYSLDKKMIADLKELFYYLGESHISIWVSTPSFAEMCLADNLFDSKLLPELETMLFCGELLPNESVRRLQERFDGMRVINLYGPTEATVAVTAIEVDREMCRSINPLPVGYVKDDCRIVIAGPGGNEVAPGEKGEILIAGESVSTGYYKSSEMTEKAFFRMEMDGTEKRCYRTGDEGYIKNDMLFFCGRMDFQIKLSGYRIELEDIEHNMRKIEYVKNAVVLPVTENSKTRYLLAVVVLSEHTGESEFETGLKIRRRLKAILPEYMVPRKIAVRDSLPMNTNGKVDRKRLLKELT